MSAPPSRLPARRAPDAGGSNAPSLRCPRCATSPLRRALTEDAPILECERCAGHWVPRTSAPALARTFPDVKTIDRARLEKLRAFAGARLERDIHYLRCPACAALMARKQFALGSAIVIDRCVADGVWFDAGELELARGYFAAGGPTDAAERKSRDRRAPRAVPSAADGVPALPASTLAELLLWLL